MYVRWEALKQEQDPADTASRQEWQRRSVGVPSHLLSLVPAAPTRVRMPGSPMCRGAQVVDPFTVTDPVNIYLLARGQVCRCLPWATCHHHNHPYLWLWPPFLQLANPLRLFLPNPGQHACGLTSWRHGFAMDSLLASRNVWPTHLPHMTHLTPDTPTTGKCCCSASCTADALFIVLRKCDEIMTSRFNEGFDIAK